MERNGTSDEITPEGKGQHHNVESTYLLAEFINHFVRVFFIGSGFWGGLVCLVAFVCVFILLGVCLLGFFLISKAYSLGIICF